MNGPDIDVTAETVLQDAITRSLTIDGYPGRFVNSFLVITETVNGDGERELTHYWNDESTAWQRIGMLETILADEKHNWLADQDDDAG